LNVNYMSKEQILYTYLQLVPIYGNLCGVSSVSEQMLGKRVKDLTVNEQVTIISALPGPDIYNPIRHPEDALKQRNITAQKIIENGTKNASMTPEELEQIEAVKAMPLPKFVDPNYPEVGQSSWVSQTIKSELRETKLPSTIYGKGYQIETTFDPRMQTALENLMVDWNDQGRFGSKWEVSMIVLDSKSFGIKAIMGHRDPVSPTNQFNLAIDSTAQTGSMFKVSVYATDLQRRVERQKEGTSDQGLSSIYITRPLWPIAGPTGTSMSINTALKDSINTAAAASQQNARDGDIPGGQRLVDTYGIFGTKLDVDPEDPTTALGTADLSLLELATVPASLMNGGTKPTREAISHTPVTSIARIRDKDGNVVYDSDNAESSVVFDPDVCDVMRRAMKAVVTDGTGKAASVKGLDVIGKTGTTDSSKTIGFLFGFVSHGKQYTGVMRIKHRDNEALGGLYGGTFVAPLVREAIVAMDESLDKK
jgi:penicillin-binding protein 1A